MKRRRRRRRRKMNKSNQLKRPQRRGWPAAKEGETKWRPLGGSNRFIDGAFNSIQIQISDIPRRMASQVSGETESGIRRFRPEASHIFDSMISFNKAKKTFVLTNAPSWLYQSSADRWLAVKIPGGGGAGGGGGGGGGGRRNLRASASSWMWVVWRHTSNGQFSSLHKEFVSKSLWTDADASTPPPPPSTSSSSSSSRVNNELIESTFAGAFGLSWPVGR